MNRSNSAAVLDLSRPRAALGAARVRPALARASAVALGLVFLSAASYKLVNYGAYVPEAGRFVPGWMPQGAAHVAVAALPAVEAYLGGLLLFRRWRRLASLLVGSLLVLFTFLVALHYEGGRVAGLCGCNWPFLRVLTPARLDLMLLRNAVLILLSVCVFLG